MLLSAGPCCDSAANDPTLLLTDDVQLSDASDLATVEGLSYVSLCRAHANHYKVARQVDRCASDGCTELWTTKSDGINRCDHHSRGQAKLAPVVSSAAPLVVGSVLKDTGRVAGSDKTEGLYEVWIPVVRGARPAK